MTNPVTLTVRKSLRMLTRSHRPPDAHILSRQGKAHAADNINNQDSAFAVLRAQRRGPGPDVEAGPREELLVAAVFDGHGAQGTVASRLARDSLEKAVTTLVADASIPLQDVARKAFAEVSAVLDQADCAQDSGTTASVVVVGEQEVVVAFVGDSAVAFVGEDTLNTSDDSVIPLNSGCVRFLSRLHRVSEPDEAERIVAAGGMVHEGYVVDKGANNGIAVTRTLGDVDMHAYGCIGEPEIHTLKRRKDDSALILATDGLWDSPGVSVESVARITLRRRGRTARRVCDRLFDLVENSGGPQDDCTIVCVTLN